MPEPVPAHYSLTFQLSLREVYKSNLAIAHGNVGKLRRILWIILAVPFTVELILLIAKGAGAEVTISSSDIVVGLMLPVVFIFVFYGAPYFAAKSAYKSSANFHHAILWVLTEEVVTQEVATGRGEYLWSTFIKVRETRELFLFYVQKNLAYPIPKRAFANPQEIEGFCALIRRHVENVALRSG